MTEKVNKIIYGLGILLLVGVGLIIRFYDLTDAPLDFNSTRQLHSAIIARGMYYQNLESAPQWQRDVAVRNWTAEGLIEPPILEALSAMTYRLIGQETLIVPRVYSIMFWMIGGWFLFLIARRIAGKYAALISLAYFLVLPFGAIASRAFQPDPLLTMAIIVAWWSMLRWQQKQTWKRLILAGTLSGLAILIKTTAVFFIAPAWVVLVFALFSLRRVFTNPQVWTAAVLSILPYGLFLVYGLFFSGQLASQFSLRFFPSLWFDPVWYLQWNGQIRSTVGLEWFLIAFAGSAVIKDKSQRWMFLSIWLGYFLYGLTLPFHIYTHDYYQEPLVPLVALGLAVAANALFEHFPSPKWLPTVVVVGVTVYMVVIQAWDVRVTLAKRGFDNEIIFWTQFGDHLGHDKKVEGLTQDYGYRLSYYGWVENSNWITAADMAYRQLGGIQIDEDNLFKEQTQGKDLFVVTLMDEFERQSKLKDLLNEHYPILEQKNDYILYDLRHPIKPLE